MITIIHTEGGGGIVLGESKKKVYYTPAGWGVVRDACRYALGDLPPRYPVPASMDLTPQYDDGEGLNGWMYFLFCPFKAFLN